MNQNKLSFQSQNLIVDYLEFKFNVLPEFIKQKIVQSFFKLGFNSFDVDKKYRDPVQDSIQTNSNNQYQIQFVVNVSRYWNGVCVAFPGNSAAFFYQLLKKNPELTKGYVEEALAPIEDSLIELHKKVDTLLPQAKKPRVIQPLRDPLDKKLFPLFLNQAGNSFSYQKDLKQAQMRIAYTILFYVGLRANEIRQLSKKDIINAQNAAQLHVIHHKTKKAHIHILSPTAVEAFKDLDNAISIVFDKYKYSYLFGKHEPVGKKMVLANINRDLKHTCELLDLPYNIKSHSFRINVISGLLKHTSVQNAADIIGHQDIRSTMAYQRYALSRKEIEDLLTKNT